MTNKLKLLWIYELPFYVQNSLLGGKPHGARAHGLGSLSIIFKARIVDAMMREPNTNLAMGHAAYAAGAMKNTWNDYTRRLLDEYEDRLPRA